jgi:hypothetical protein
MLARSLDSIVKNAIEKHGTEMAGASVRVSSVQIDVKEGRGTIRGLRIANPDGFSGGDAVSLGEITLDLDVESFRKEPYVIDQIRVEDPELRLELNDAGAANLDRLRSNVEAYAPSSSGGGNAPTPLLRVARFDVTGGRMQLDATAVGGEAGERSVPEIALRDVGGAGGIPANQVGKEILRSVLRKAVEGAARDELTRLAKKELGEQVGDAVGGVLDKLGGD